MINDRFSVLTMFYILLFILIYGVAIGFTIILKINLWKVALIMLSYSIIIIYSTFVENKLNKKYPKHGRRR